MQEITFNCQLMHHRILIDAKLSTVRLKQAVNIFLRQTSEYMSIFGDKWFVLNALIALNNYLRKLHAKSMFAVLFQRILTVYGHEKFSHACCVFGQYTSYGSITLQQRNYCTATLPLNVTAIFCEYELIWKLF